MDMDMDRYRYIDMGGTGTGTWTETATWTGTATWAGTGLVCMGPDRIKPFRQAIFMFVCFTDMYVGTPAIRPRLEKKTSLLPDVNHFDVTWCLPWVK
jgi:hypothetical protein